MSLYETTANVPGHDQADVASMDLNGLHYRCYVWLNRIQYRVEAACYRVQADGSEVPVFANIVASATSTEATDTAGRPLDCPKIIASGNRFVVHWLQATTTPPDSPRNWALHRSVMNMAAFDASANGWTAQGSTALDQTYALYDVAPIIGAATSASGGVPFVVAWSTADNVITVARFTTTNFLWASTAWSVTINQDHDPRVLAVYAHESDNDVIVSYQRPSDEMTITAGLYSTHLDADDGGSAATVKTFTLWETSGNTAGQFLQVGHCRVAANRVTVVAEAIADDLISAATSLGNRALNLLHHVLFREINSDTAARVGNEHGVANLYMVSRPWAYANGTTAGGSQPDVYCVLAYKSAYHTNDWQQAAIFACNLEYPSWQHSTAVQTAFLTGSNIRPRSVANFVHTGIPDARPSNSGPEVASAAYSASGLSKRSNHLTSLAGAPPGADVKTRTAAVGVWARMGTVRGVDESGTEVAELQPENLGVTGFVVYMEEPSTIFRDSTDATQPVDNFKGSYPRAIAQTCGAGRSLFKSGGNPSLYDGRQIVECGFAWTPEILLMDPYTDGGAFTGQLTTGGVYQWYAVFTWRDNAGQMHRSGPSRVIEYDLGASENGMQMRIRTLTISMRDSTFFYPLSQSIQVELFRTPESAHANYPTFYRVFGGTQVVAAETGGFMRVRDTPVNDPRARFGYIDVADGLSDADLILQGLGPYQYGEDPAEGLVGPLPQCSPALTVCCSWLNRVFGADALDPAIIWYTDEIFPDFGSDYALAPFFTDAQTFRIGEVGEITAMQPMDNALVVFTASHVYTLDAQDIGGGLLQLSATVRHTGTGCINPQSVVLAPPGIFFQSAKGYYLLNRGFELEADIGAMVEDEIREAGNIASADLLEDRNEVRLTCNGRPLTTYTTTWTVQFAGDGSGTWSITFSGYGEVANVEADLDVTEEELANALAADISTLISSGAINHLVQSATPDGDQVEVVWVADVVPAYTDTSPPGTSLTGVDTSAITTLPRVLIYDYYHRLWSRADIVQTSATPRMSELVGATTWRLGSGETSHVIAAQGAVLVERAASDSLAFTDQTSVANVGIPIDVETSWLHLAGMSGWKRIRSIGLQAEKPNATALYVDLSFDTTGTHDAFDVETQEGIEWASPAPPYGRIRPRIQRMTSIKVRIYEQSGVANTENVALYGLTFEVGVEKGLRRVADSQIGS